jgi:hypothetical protein
MTRSHREHTDAAHALVLLRARRERPRRRAEKRDEFAPFHAKLSRVEDKAYQTAVLCVTTKLAGRCRSWVSVKLGHSGNVRCTTALPPKADVHPRSCYVAFVPIAS